MSGLALKQSSAKGKGVFTTHAFKTGEILMKFEGRTKEWEDIEDDSYEDRHCLQIAKTTYMMTDENPNDIDDFVNHSCEPNCAIKKINDEIILVALRDLKEGEEATYDYTSWEDDPTWQMDCHCGSKTCRKLIRAFRFLPEELKEKFKAQGIAAPYL